MILILLSGDELIIYRLINGKFVLVQKINDNQLLTQAIEKSRLDSKSRHNILYIKFFTEIHKFF